MPVHSFSYKYGFTGTAGEFVTVHLQHLLNYWAKRNKLGTLELIRRNIGIFKSLRDVICQLG